MKRGKFSLSNYKLFSCDMGELVPIGLQEVLPGDTFQQSTSALIRAAPLMAPVMHPVHVHIRHFFVPHRLIWESWEDFITGGPDGMDTSVFPTINLTYTAGTPPTGSNVIGSLADYLGCPSGVNNLAVSALPFRAYALVYNEFYRDQDLTTPLNWTDADGPDAVTSTVLQHCAWEKDYFTSSRPWEQKGPAITIPLGTTAPVTITNPGASGPMRVSASATGSDARSMRMNTGTPNINYSGTALGTASDAYYVSGLTGTADLTGASAVTVNVLREAMALQRYEEARARFGSRYTEYLRYLGVRSSDARLQRPEYLGGGKQTIQFSEVLQTAEGTSPVGQLRGHGIGAMRSNRYRRFFEEHGYVISLMSVRPKTMYMQGLKRHWNRRTKEDFWQKELQHIGQQEVLNKELYAAHASPDGVFGFQDRYDEYRRTENTVAGEFKSSTLNYWHFARDFGSGPALNNAFVQCNPTLRPFADQTATSDRLYIMAHHSIQARRMVAQSGNSFIF